MDTLVLPVSPLKKRDINSKSKTDKKSNSDKKPEVFLVNGIEARFLKKCVQDKLDNLDIKDAKPEWVDKAMTECFFRVNDSGDSVDRRRKANENRAEEIEECLRDIEEVLKGEKGKLRPDTSKGFREVLEAVGVDGIDQVLKEIEAVLKKASTSGLLQSVMNKVPQVATDNDYRTQLADCISAIDQESFNSVPAKIAEHFDDGVYEKLLNALYHAKQDELLDVKFNELGISGCRPEKCGGLWRFEDDSKKAENKKTTNREGTAGDAATAAPVIEEASPALFVRIIDKYITKQIWEKYRGAPWVGDVLKILKSVVILRVEALWLIPNDLYKTDGSRKYTDHLKVIVSLMAAVAVVQNCTASMAETPPSAPPRSGQINTKKAENVRKTLQY